MIRRIIQKLLPPYGSLYMSKNKKYSKFDIGEWTYGRPKVFKTRGHGNLKIGKFCSIARGVTFLLIGDHRIDWVSSYPFSTFFEKAFHYTGFPKLKGDIIIGNDVWIGHNAVILPGITIGNGAVIGAYCVLAKDVPPYAVVVGNPGKIVKYRFSDKVTEDLQKIAWWNWPLSKIEDSYSLMHSTDIEAFIEKYKNNS